MGTWIFLKMELFLPSVPTKMAFWVTLLSLFSCGWKKKKKQEVALSHHQATHMNPKLSSTAEYFYACSQRWHAHVSVFKSSSSCIFLWMEIPYF